MRNNLTPRPVINAKKCTRCGRCVQVCPAQPKALSWANGEENAPVYDYSHCIRCYCCQELCPHQAITVKVPLLGKLIRR
jgi:formate hydrogenlyase subunit 6/NADH:ubiquinone oxidoreductase subunit I